jgi:uncharacterized delta-60 repeat protein
VAVVATLAIAAAAYALPGVPDRGFGTGGSTTIDFRTNAQASVSLQQPDGKTVVIGTVGSTGFALARYDADGALDPSFGIDGRTLTEVGGDVAVRGASIQEDGKILVTGTADGAEAAARYDTDGSLDPTFGSEGIARNSSLAATAASAAAVAARPAATVAPAAVAEDFAAEFGAQAAEPLALAVGPGPRLLVAGTASIAGVPQLAVAELDRDGSPNEAFGDAGRALYPPADRVGPARVEAAAVQDDGNIVVAGTPGPTDSSPDELVLSRYGPGGSLDESFGTGGAAVLSQAAAGDDARGLTVEPSGRIVVARGGSGFGLTALTPAGQLDRSFGRDGRARASLGGGVTAEGIAAAGAALLVYGESSGRIALARYSDDGSLDRSFGRGGTVLSSIPAYDAGTERATVELDGGIVVAGSYHGRFALARFRADGSLDRAFGDGGEEISNVRGTATAVGAAPDGAILVAGSPPNPGGGEFVVAAFDGSAAAGELIPSERSAGEPRHVTRAAAEPRRPHRLGAPNPVPAWYINASNFTELKRFAAQDACKFAGGQPKTAQRTLILDFGGARAYADGSFGAAVNNATFEAKNKQIRAALKAAADAYAACHRRGRATIMYANTNHFSLQSSASRAHRIGLHQATTVAGVGGYMHHAGYSPAEHAGVAGDIEPGFWGPSSSKALANGAKSVRNHGYVEFGTAGGCPPYLKRQPRPQHHMCLNDWTLDDVAHVSNAGGGEPLPEIYYRGGRYHYDQAAQWASVARRWNSKHATPYSFFGATASTEFSALAPVTSWKRLKRKTTGHVGRELVNFRQDRWKPVPAARGPDAPRR